MKLLRMQHRETSREKTEMIADINSMEMSDIVQS